MTSLKQWEQFVSHPDVVHCDASVNWRENGRYGRRDVESCKVGIVYLRDMSYHSIEIPLKTFTDLLDSANILEASHTAQIITLVEMHGILEASRLYPGVAIENDSMHAVSAVRLSSPSIGVRWTHRNNLVLAHKAAQFQTSRGSVLIKSPPGRDWLEFVPECAEA